MSDIYREFEDDIPNYALGYELVRREIGHVDRDTAGFPAVHHGQQTELAEHPAVVAMRDEIIARIADLTGMGYLWRVYHLYVTPFRGLRDDGIVSRVTVVGEVYITPEDPYIGRGDYGR